MPVFGTSAARCNDYGVAALYQHLLGLLSDGRLRVGVRASTGRTSVVPATRARYLAEIADAVREHHRTTEEQAGIVHRRGSLRTTAELPGEDAAAARVRELLEAADRELLPEVRELL